MSVKITDNSSKLKSEASQNYNIALRLMASAIVVESTPKTPKKFGLLRQNVLKEVVGLNAKVSWNQDYAEIQEVKQFTNYTTPGTGPHFAENAVKTIVDKADQFFREAGAI